MLNLSSETKEFLKNNPKIKIANKMDRPPYDFVKNGLPAGISIDLSKKISEILGLEIEWINGYTWPELLLKLENKELDILPSILKPENVKFYANFTNPILQMTYGIMTTKDFDSNNIFMDLSNLKVAYSHSYGGRIDPLNSYTNVTKVPIKNPKDGINMLITGEIDAFIGDLSSFSYYTHHYYKNKIITRPLLNFSNEHYKNSLTIGIRNDWALLIKAFNAAIKFIYEEEYEKILNRYIGYENVNTKNFAISETAPFTKKEVEWLYNNKVIPIYLMNNFPPISYFENTTPSGIAVGYLKQIENELGIKFYHKSIEKNLPYGLDMLTKGEVKLIPSLADTKARREMGLDFGSPYIELPISIYGNHQNGYIQDLSIISRSNYKVLVIKGHAIMEWLQQDYKDINITGVKSAEFALSLVNKNSNYFFVGDTITTNRVLAENHFKEILHVGTTEYSYKLNMAFNKHDIQFKNILEKIMPSIQRKYSHFIESYWTGQKVDAKTDPIIYILLAAILLIVIIIIYFQSYIYRERHKLLKRHAMTDPMTNLYNRRYLENIYSDEKKRSHRNKTNLVFMIFDIDYFKPYNDTYGHAMGDDALKKVADNFRETFQRGGDYCFRLGGEEFGVLTTVSNKSNAYTLANQMRTSLKELKIEHSKNQPHGVITISGGVIAIESDDSMTFDKHYRLADIQLYKAKENGRDRIL